MKHIKPTIFGGVPRLYNRMYEAVSKKFEDQQGLAKWLVDAAVNSKKNALHSSGSVSSLLYDTAVFKKVQ
jgi:long-chain acyl-CoA synthetase